MRFKDIVGQRDLINHLTKIIDSGHVGHAQLFLGDNGYGSMALAIAYAQYLNCQNRQHYDSSSELRADSCGECPNCKKYQQLSHSDLHLFFPTNTNKSVKKDPTSDQFASDFREFMLAKGQYASLDQWYDFIGIDNKQGFISKDDAREIVRTLGLKPYEQAYKVVVVWMAEQIDAKVASGVLLKMLEEPLGNTLILLVVEDRNRLLSTILSRTQLVRVGKIDNISLQQALERETGNPVSAALVAASEGNLLTARNNLAQSDEQKHMGELFVDWMRMLFKLNMAQLSEWVDNMSKQTREQQKVFLQYALDAVRACYLKTSAGLELSYKLQFGDEKFNASFASFVTNNNIEQLMKAFGDAILAVSRNGNGKILFMELSFSISKALKKR